MRTGTARAWLPEHPGGDGETKKRPYKGPARVDTIDRASAGGNCLYKKIKGKGRGGGRRRIRRRVKEEEKEEP